MNADMTKTEALLSVKNLHKSFGKLDVLQGVTLDILSGDVVAIIGPSGCGKSTFLRCLNFLEDPTSGKISFKGDVIFKNERRALKKQLKALKAQDKKAVKSAEYQTILAEYTALRAEEKAIEKTLNQNINMHRQKVGMVFQQFNLFPHLTVLKNITLAPMKLKKVPQEEAEQKAMELLDKIGLADKANAYPATLSGGQNSVLRLCALWRWSLRCCFSTNRPRRWTLKWLAKF